jgi:hypothetical protein
MHLPPRAVRVDSVVLLLLASATASACATGDADDTGDAIASTSTTAATMTSVTASPTSDAPTTASDASDTPVTEGVDGSSTAASPDVPVTCDPGLVDCPCDDGECVDATAFCIADVCVADVECDPDQNEPNEFSDEPTDLGEISDDDAETVEFIGVLDDPDDVDWFTYHGTDALGETVDPARTLQVFGGTLELCKFFTCDVGEAQVLCPAGTMSITEGTRHGCCSPSSFAFDADGIECIGGAFETGGTVLMRLQNASDQCVGYSGTAHF